MLIAMHLQWRFSTLLNALITITLAGWKRKKGKDRTTERLQLRRGELCRRRPHPPCSRRRQVQHIWNLRARVRIRQRQERRGDLPQRYLWGRGDLRRGWDNVDPTPAVLR